MKYILLTILIIFILIALFFRRDMTIFLTSSDTIMVNDMTREF